MQRTTLSKPANRFALLATAAIFVLSGCARTVHAPLARPPLPPLPEPVGPIVRAEPRINGNISDATVVPEIAMSSGTGSRIVAPQARFGAGGGAVSLDFADTDIREVAAQILGNSLHLSYTIDPNVHGTATLRTVTPLAESQLLPVLQSLLAQNGATLVQSGGIYRVLPSAAAVGVAGGAGTAGTIMVPLRYAGAEDLTKALQPFAQGTTKVIAVTGANALLVAGEPAQREALIGVIGAFDTDLLAGQSYALLPVTNGDAADFATAFASALRAQSGGALAAQIKVVPLARVNAVLVVTGNPKYLTDARRLYAVIERGRRATTRTWHVYYLQNSTANDIAYILQQAFTPGNVTAQPTARGTGQPSSASQSSLGGSGSGTGGSGSTGSSGTSGSGGSGSGGGASGGLGSGLSGLSGGQGGLSAAPTSAASSNPLLGGIGNSGGGGADASTNTMRIIPNPENNAILVYATGEEEGTVEQMMHKIDILPLEVRIDAVIAEVTLTDTLKYGTQFYFKHHGLVGGNTTKGFGDSTTLGTVVSGLGALAGPGAGSFLAAAGKDGEAIIDALQDITTVKVLSSPQLLVLDNETAQLSVGNQVPYLSAQTSNLNSGTNTVTNSVNYRNTGVITQVTPRVNSGGLVTLDIAQEVSGVAALGSGGSTIGSPTFTDRAVKSRIVVQDGQTVGIAGLITDTNSTENSGLPYLKDVPLLGTLLGNQDNTRTRTELLVLLTPHVLHDQRDARALTEDLREQLPRAAAAVYDLQDMQANGSSDPQAHLRRRILHPVRPD